MSLKVKFFSKNEHYHDQGPTYETLRIATERDKMFDAHGNEIAQFLVNAW